MTKGDILNQESKLYGAIKESDIKVLEELLNDDLLFVFQMETLSQRKWIYKAVVMVI